MLAELAGDVAAVSLLAIGGLSAVLPELQRRFVDAHGWLTSSQFADLFALAQASPGPNMLFLSLVGWQIAGLPGALVATGAMIGPTSVLTFAVMRVWDRFRDAPLRTVLQAALIPITVGLVLAAAWLITHAADDHAAAYALTGVTALVVTTTRLHPLWLIAGGALLGLLGVV